MLRPTARGTCTAGLRQSGGMAVLPSRPARRQGPGGLPLRAVECAIRNGAGVAFGSTGHRGHPSARAARAAGGADAGAGHGVGAGPGRVAGRGGVRAETGRSPGARLHCGRLGWHGDGADPPRGAGPGPVAGPGGGRRDAVAARPGPRRRTRRLGHRGGPAVVRGIAAPPRRPPRPAARAAALAPKWPAFFVAFDVLQHDGEELLVRPYAERRALLENLFSSTA